MGMISFQRFCIAKQISVQFMCTCLYVYLYLENSNRTQMEINVCLFDANLE